MKTPTLPNNRETGTLPAEKLVDILLQLAGVRWLRYGGNLLGYMKGGIAMFDFSVMQSCENPHIQYVELPDIRLIFFDGEYMGFYFA